MMYKYNYEIEIIDHDHPFNKTVAAVNEIFGDTTMKYAVVRLTQTIRSRFAPNKETISGLASVCEKALEGAKKDKPEYEIVSVSLKSVEVDIDSEDEDELHSERH